MNEKIQRKLFYYLKKKKIEHFIGVLDSTLNYFIDECLKNIKKLEVTVFLLVKIFTSKERSTSVSFTSKTIGYRVIKSL